MNDGEAMDIETRAALARLFDLASHDTGQARRAADFLIAWWNAEDHGGFDIASLFSLGRGVAADMACVFAFLGQHSGAIYADAYGYRPAMEDILQRWRQIS